MGIVYFRCLRKYLDDYNSGTIKDESLDPYKEIIKGKFVIYNAEPSISGGMLVTILFIDSPSHVFSASVYSIVDEKAKKVVSYSVRGIIHRDDDSGITKKEILEMLKEHPENKLW